MSDEMNSMDEERDDLDADKSSDLGSDLEMNMNADEVTSEDKLFAALGYPIPLIPIVMLLMEDKKDRRFIRYHAIQSLVLNVAVWIAITLISVVTFGIGAVCAWIIWFVVLWPAIDSFSGNYTNIPVLTDFMKNQGWIVA